MGQHRIILAKLFFERVVGFFWLPVASHDAERSIRSLRPTGKPLVSPRTRNRPGESTFSDDLDVPAKHLSMLVLRMTDRVHAELARDQRPLLRRVLLSQQVTFEVALI